MNTKEQIREYWDTDAATYDRSAGHHPATELQRSAWRGALSRLLGATTGARVLDVGAGTGFLSLLLAELGCDVTAVDLSPGMLAQLSEKAAARHLPVTVVEGDAVDVPQGPYDIVISRHLLWLLPDPVAALRVWAASTAPAGSLVLVESLWGQSAGAAERVRRIGRQGLRRMRRSPPDHHAELDDNLRCQLPLGHGPGPDELVETVVAAGWRAPRLHRLPGVEWAMRRDLAWPERMLGVAPRFAVVAEEGTAVSS